VNVESKLSRRNVLQFGSAAAVTGCATPALVDVGIAKATSLGLVDYLKSSPEGWSIHSFANWIGAANAFKEGDAIIGVAAKDDEHRKVARMLLANTRLYQIDANPIFSDDLHRAIISSIDETVAATLRDWTLGALRDYLLAKEEADIKAIMPGLSSDVIGCVVKLLSDEELTAIASKIFNALPGSNIGERGYLGARIQPNSPTDNIDDIAWQVFNGFAYGVGDVVIGTNPVSSEPESVHAIEVALKDIVDTFGLSDVLPHCVLAHIDVQAEVEKKWPSSTALWFQSIAGSDAANKTFDLSLDRLVKHADQRQGKFGMYFETGQGADFTNGHGQSMDMVLHESRKYGLARFLSLRIAAANGRRPWLHVNDVAGFIGPEVFRNRDQLVRCCLEDLVMGKLHGLCIGLDVCSTLHMDVSLDDLDYCLERVAPANPAYLMASDDRLSGSCSAQAQVRF
jgi:ethanolamine ammonia-lyase large subunit